MAEELVRDWMTIDPITIPGHTSLPEANQIMIERRVRRLPVVDEDKVVGIVTWGDLRQAMPSSITSFDILELGNLLSRTPISKLMTTNPVTIGPGESIIEAARLMLEHRISGLPVMDGDQLVGIITESDIFRMLASGNVRLVPVER